MSTHERTDALLSGDADLIGAAGHPAAAIAKQIARLTRRVLAATTIYAVVATAAFVGLALLLFEQVARWTKMLPAGVKPSWQRMIGDRPEILLLSAAGVVLGLALLAAGLLTWRAIFGARRMPPRKLLVVLSSLPVGLAVVGSLPTAGTTPLGALAAPVLLGMAFAMIPFEIGLLAYGMLRLASRQVEERPAAIPAAELPSGAARYFDAFADAAEQSGLQPVGDFRYEPQSHKFRRYYVASNGAYFAEATFATIGMTELKGLSVFSATDDGHYFETSDIDHRLLWTHRVRV